MFDDCSLVESRTVVGVVLLTEVLSENWGSVIPVIGVAGMCHVCRDEETLTNSPLEQLKTEINPG